MSKEREELKPWNTGDSVGLVKALRYHMDLLDDDWRAKGNIASRSPLASVLDEAAEHIEILAHQETSVPEGWKLVPVEPTEAMIHAVWHHWLNGTGHSEECMGNALRAMLATAPSPPTSQETT